MIFKKQIQAEEILKSEKEKLKNAEYWISFLKTSAMQYKHNWNTQIAIHEAMPDSIACTEAKIWKENGCTLTDTANAIITEKNGKICRLFDISQVSGEFTKSYWIWKVNDDELNVDYSEALNDTLCSKYNFDSETLAETIYSIALNKTAEFIDKNSDVYNVISESVAYTVIQRCCPDEVEMSYDSIENALKTTSIDKIGTAVTSISKILLTEIEKIVKKERTSEIDRRGLDEYNREHINKRNEMRVQSEQEKILPDNQDSGRENLHTERKDIPLHSDIQSGIRPELNNYSTAFEMPEGSGGTENRGNSVLNDFANPIKKNYDIDRAFKIMEVLKREGIKYSYEHDNESIITIDNSDLNRYEDIVDKLVGFKSIIKREEGDFFIYENHATLDSFNNISNIIIPNEINGYPVTAIGVSASERAKDIESIIIPDTVQTIKYRAFYNCKKLKNVELKNGIKSIDREAFYSCSQLESITLPESVEEIGDWAFNNCENLNEIIILNPNCNINHLYSFNGIIKGYENSTAHKFAVEHNYKFELLNNKVATHNISDDSKIIGNTTYKYIPQKSYRKYDIDIAMKISEKLESENIKYSGKIADDTITFTVSKPDVSKLEEIAEKIKEDLDFIFEADTKKFANGELSTADKSVGFKPYIIADLKTWTNNSPERSKLEHYETLDEAFKRFDELRNEPYNSEIALHKQDNFPMARLTLGVESSDGEYAFDVIHVRAGQNYLCDDFTRIPDVFTNKNFTDILTNISENITIDRIAIYEKDENGNYKDTPEDVAFNDVKSKELFTELGEEYSKLIPDNNEKSFAEQIDDVLSGTANRYDDIKVCDTPQILLDCGLQQLPMLYTKRHLKKALEPKDLRKHNHGLTTEQIKKIPFLLENPVIIYDSLNRNDSIIVLTSEIDDYNEPIIVSIQTNGKGVYHLERVDSNFITSIYGRENIDKQLNYAAEQDKILFIDKTKSQDLFSVLRLQFSEGLNNLDSNIIIHQSRNIVNTNAEKTEQISDDIFKEAIYPSLASDEWTAITTEFFSYETAWHNVDEKISSLAKSYRSGKDVTAELGQYFGVGRSLGTSPDDKKFILHRNENSVKITHIQSNHSAEYTWSDIGSIQLQMLKDRFKEDTLDAIREYPDTAAINNHYIERMESENYPEKESTEKLMPIVIEKYGLEIDFNEIEDITFEIGENLSIICFYSKENTLFRDESGVNSSLSPVEALSSATDEIEKLFDMSVNNPDIKIFINHKDNTQQLLNPEKMREDVLKNRISKSDKIIENLENTLKELQPENKLELEIDFSESGEIERFKSEYLNGEPMSYALGNALLEYLDEKQHTERETEELNVGWYHKTDFSIKAVINGEDYSYNGRYDIGDGKDGGNGSLSEHIRQYNEYAVTNNPYHLTDEELEERLEILNVFVPFLEENSVLNEKEQQIFDTYISENPVRTEINLENSSDNSKDIVYRIYQIKSGEEYHYARFSSFESNIEHNIQLNKDDYDLVYEGNLSDINGSSVEDKLSKIYEIFNLNHPEDFRGHSLSVSDVITVDDTNAYYVDSFGFKNFPAFFLEKTKELENDSKRTAEDIAIGDKYMYKGAEVTVASLTGVYPDDIGISKKEELNGRAFSVTTNINKHNLHNEGKYLGNLNENIENTMTADKFYENRDTQSVTWMYYNPDGNDGKGQFIETVIYKEDIENALNKANSSRNSTQAFMDTFYNCTQTITDRGTESFSTAEKYYNEAEYDFAVEGNYNDTLSDIRNYLTDYYNSFDNVPALTQADIDILRTLEPRKSILNFTSEEIKLTEKWQQRFEADIDKKSPYYRAVNGDWREHEATSVPVLTIEDRNANFKSVSEDIKSQVIKRGIIENNDTKWKIQVSRRGLEDSLTYARRNNDSAVFNMLYHIEEFVVNSIHLDCVISEKNNNNKANNTAFMHKFYSLCSFNDEPYLAKIAVEEFADGQADTLKRMYNIQDIKIESLRHAAFTDKQLALSVLNDSNISISDLFKIVKTCDNDFYLNKGENHIEQISLFDMPENTSEITEESKEIVWTPITETADDNGKPTSYSTLYKGERYWITQVDKYKFDIEYDTVNGIQAINDDFSGFSSRSQAEDFFEEEIDDFLELTQTHSEQEISETDIAETDYSPMANNKNYHIETDNFELGGEKSKFKANIEAIRTMKTIESENRTATHEEMEIMSKYTGWGGLQNAFDNRKDNWSNEYAELKNLLTEDEYLSAKASVLDSFYTPPFVIDSIYKALENMGFEGGKILDPATGVGNFLGKMPESISVKSKITAVEKDSISGRIAKALYPEAEINISGFEDTVYPDNTFDVAIGNIPFGDFKLSDKNYDKHNFMIHDYFFAKSIDKVHSGGIIAFITSKGTLDKANPKVRKYISERADLIGAIRLPNSTFKSYAGTEVTSDIIFLQKREQLNDIAPDWVYTDIDKNGFSVNSYFASHPEMILGETVEGNKLYGSKDTMVVPFENSDLKELLDKAVDNIKGEYKNIAVKKENTEKAKSILPANPDIRNYSFGEIDGKIYYREDNILTLQNLSGKRLARMKGMCDISKQVHKLLDMQLEGHTEEVLQTERDELNRIYDKFISEHGLLNEKANADLFYKDVSAPLLLSLEIVKDGKLEDKSAIFTRTTIKPPTVITHAESSQDALIVSISEKACVDMDFMQELTGKSEDEIYNELKGDIFKDPLSNNGKARYITADEYLSGNIREKLKIAKLAAENSGEFELNVNALENSMPVPLEAGEIAAQLGSSWIDTKYIEQFIREKLDIKNHYIDVKVHHNEYTASWNIENKSILTNSSHIKSTEEYGTSRKSAAEIIENSLNMRDTSVYDVVYNPDTEKEERILNHDETLLARQKQTTLQNEFKDWIFEDADRRNALVEKYNVLYNSVRQRQYNGENLTFGGMTTDIQMKPHQKDAIAHALYGGNTLFAHKVGAGKTFEMIATAMEGKRLGLHSKSLIAVPNHMTRQFANDFFKLYPNANILVAEEKDFAKDNRRNLIAKIATGDFDAVIIGHSQLIKIPISREREEAYINKEISNVVAQIENMKAEKGDSFTIKDMERVRKNLQAKLDKLLSKPVRDNVVTFEQLGVDKLIIDEADMFKNLFINTKMSNLSGVATNENVQKTQDLFMKCQYLNEITDGKGIVFATGTPISNSISEAYVMQKYLNPKALEESGLAHFDAWAANFAQKVTRTEFSPDGRGFRTKTRLAKFNNLPELMSMFKDFTDIKMAEDLNLPEPECERHTISVEATPVQKDLMQSLG